MKALRATANWPGFNVLTLDHYDHILQFSNKFKITIKLQNHKSENKNFYFLNFNVPIFELFICLFDCSFVDFIIIIITYRDTNKIIVFKIVISFIS